MEQSHDLVITVSGGTITSINPAGLHILGASGPQDVIGKSLSDLSANPSADISDTRQVQWVKLDGTEIDLEISSLLKVAEGQAEHVIVGRDMTPIKKAERLFRESQSQRHRLSELYLALIGVE